MYLRVVISKRMQVLLIVINLTIPGAGEISDHGIKTKGVVVVVALVDIRNAN